MTAPLDAAALDAYAEKVVADAPPLSAEQRDAIVAALLPRLPRPSRSRDRQGKR